MVGERLRARRPGTPAWRGALHRAAEVLVQGGVCAYPTETVYGLGSHWASREGVERIYRLKGRPRDEPLLVLVPGPHWLVSIAREVGVAARQLARSFWPGPLTLVLPAAATVPPHLWGPDQTVALRLSPHPFVRDLLAHLGAPITSTSANPHAFPEPTTADAVAAHFGGPGPEPLDLLIDGGPSGGRLPSTIVACRGRDVMILREGALPARRILEALRGTSS